MSALLVGSTTRARTSFWNVSFPTESNPRPLYASSRTCHSTRDRDPTTVGPVIRMDQVVETIPRTSMRSYTGYTGRSQRAGVSLGSAGLPQVQEGGQRLRSRPGAVA